MNKNIELSENARCAIANLQHKNGTYRYYADTLSRLFNMVLNESDELGMGEMETISTLRALHGLREDLAYIAGTNATETEEDYDPEEIADKVEAQFSNQELITEADSGITRRIESAKSLIEQAYSAISGLSEVVTASAKDMQAEEDS